MSTVSVVATLEASNVPPRVRLDVTDVGNSPSIFSTTVTRLNPDGNIVPVRTQDGNPLTLTTAGSNRTGLLYDYEAPFQAAVTYSTLESPSTVSASVTVPESRVWLIHPGVPALSVPVGNFRPGTWAQQTAAVTRGVFYPMGRANPIVVTSGARQGIQSSMTVLTQSPADLAALQSLVADAGTLLLNIPAGLGYTMDTSYVAVGDITYAPIIDKVFEQWFDVTMPFTVVDPPAGGSQSLRTYVDLFDFASYQVLKNSYSAYSAVLAGP